jgi:RHS repeat-associated protein
VDLFKTAIGRPVELGSGSTYTQVVYGPTGGKLALMNGQNLTKAFVPLPGGGAAVYTSGGLSYYRHVDWLGSARFASTTSQTMYSSTAYAPYGEPYAQAGTTDISFTGQNADSGTGDYDFLFREYSIQGRWPSPDPAGLAAVSLGAPQSWNRYAYVLNAPTELTDPLGLLDGGKGDGCPWDAGCEDGGGWGFFLYIGCCFDGRGGSGRGGGGGGAGGPDNSGPTGQSPSIQGIAVNAFLGFSLVCTQVTVKLPGPASPPNTGTVNCALYFLGTLLRVLPTVLTGSGTIIIAGSVSALAPTPFGVAIGPQLQFALTNQGFGCAGIGGAVGTIGKTFNVGQILGGTFSTYKDVLSGLSYSFTGQANPMVGGQGIWNSNGYLLGPTGGVPGASISVTLSGCGGG